MRAYYAKVISTCHRHQALATGGMAASLFAPNLEKKILDGKKLELSLGVDGFLIYDLKFLPKLQDLFKTRLEHVQDKFTDEDLLSIPSGKVTFEGLKKNIKVGIMFISSWMSGQGTFVLEGNIEDSATAEISRFQVWQWMKHEQKIDQKMVNFELVQELSKEVFNELEHPEKQVGHDLFLELVQDSPQFITTWLNERPEFKGKN